MSVIVVINLDIKDDKTKTNGCKIKQPYSVCLFLIQSKDDLYFEFILSILNY